MAKKCCNDKEIASVQSYISKPSLLIKDREGKRRPMNLGFADAVKRYGRILREGDLASAYRKAGTSFEGQLQQNFVVMHDLNKTRVGPWGGKGGLPTLSHNLKEKERVNQRFPKDPRAPRDRKDLGKLWEVETKRGKQRQSKIEKTKAPLKYISVLKPIK